MLTPISLVLLIAACVCFFLAAFPTLVSTPKVNLTALRLAFWVLSLLLPR